MNKKKGLIIAIICIIVVIAGVFCITKLTSNKSQDEGTKSSQEANGDGSLNNDEEVTVQPEDSSLVANGANNAETANNETEDITQVEVTPEAVPSEDLEWLGTWASAQQSLDPSRNEYPPDPGLTDSTLRQVVRISVGGSQFRLKISNEYGRTPLVIDSVHISLALLEGYSVIDVENDVAITFNGSEKVEIPAGEIWTSDTIDFVVGDLQRVVISMYFSEVPEHVTSHTGARTTTYLAPGNHVSDVTLKDSSTCEQWYFITGIDVMADKNGKAIVCLGDSITDGRGVRTNLDERWTDILANRLVENESTKNVSVLNQGIGGNSVFGGLGPAMYRRFSRDVLEQQGVGYVILFEGINDIGYSRDMGLIDNIIEQYKSFADKAHEKGIKVYGATVTPFAKFPTYYTDADGEVREQMRQKLNEWIRNNEYFDGVIDFDAVIRDEANPAMLALKYSSDGLHPNFAGYKLLGNSIDLTLFED